MLSELKHLTESPLTILILINDQQSFLRNSQPCILTRFSSKLIPIHILRHNKENKVRSYKLNNKYKKVIYWYLYKFGNSLGEHYPIRLFSLHHSFHPIYIYEIFHPDFITLSNKQHIKRPSYKVLFWNIVESRVRQTLNSTMLLIIV